MKKLKYLIIASAFFAASAAMAADYDFYVSSGDTGNIDSLANWQVNGSAATSLPTASDNVVFGSVSDGRDLWVNFDLTANPGYVFEVNNMTLIRSVRFNPPNGNRGSIDNWSAIAPSIKINGDLTTDGGDVCFGRSYGDDRGFNFKNIYIGGDFFASGGVKFTYIGQNRDNYSSANPSMRLQGQLKVQDSTNFSNSYNRVALDYSSSSSSTYYKIGGLDTGTTKAIICNGNEWTGKSIIEFTQADSGKYNGTFQGGDFRGYIGILGQGSDGFDIIMNDSSGGNNKQIIRFDSSYKEGPDFAAKINVDVKNGNLSMYSAVYNVADGEGKISVVHSVTTLNLTGGTFGIVGSDSSVSTGIVQFSDNLTWTAGKIEITLNTNAGEADMLTVNDIVFGGASDATYEFVFDIIGSITEGSEYDYAIMELTGGTFSDDILSKLVGKSSDGQYLANFSYNGGTLILDSFSQIPEPSTVAAILGALALGFAAWRRRK